MAFEDDHNDPYYVDASFRNFPKRGDRSRETTPFIEDSDHELNKDKEAELRICLEQRPKNMRKG